MLLVLGLDQLRLALLAFVLASGLLIMSVEMREHLGKACLGAFTLYLGFLREFEILWLLLGSSVLRLGVTETIQILQFLTLFVHVLFHLGQIVLQRLPMPLR